MGGFVGSVRLEVLEELSPELVLVDPELAPKARLRLPEPGSFRATALPAAKVVPEVVPAAVAVAGDNGNRPRRKGRRLLLLLAAASLALNGVFIAHARSSVARPTLGPAVPHLGRVAATGALASAAGSRSQPGRIRRIRRALDHRRPVHAHPNRPRRQRVGSRVAAAKHAPRHVAAARGVEANATVQSVRWGAVPGATYYDLVMWRNGTRVLDLWPTSLHVVLPRDGRHRGAHRRLVAGRYLWFAYPGFGAKASRRYGPLAQGGVLVVNPKGGNERYTTHTCSLDPARHARAASGRGHRPQRQRQRCSAGSRSAAAVEHRRSL